MKIKDIRVSNVNLIEATYGRSDISKRLGLDDNNNYIGQLCRGAGSFGDSIARRLEKAYGFDEGWMDLLQTSLDKPALASAKLAKGARFSELLNSMSITPASLARMTKQRPQTINGWKRRGVSSKWSVAVADILHCDPEEISEATSLKDGKTLEASGSKVQRDFNNQKRELAEYLRSKVYNIEDYERLERLRILAHALFDEI